MTVKVEGDEEVVKALLELPDDIRKKLLVEVVDEVALIIMEQMKRNAPVDTGKLRDSIDVREVKPRSGEDVRRVIGTRGVHYAAHVEFGTSRHRGRAYARPAYDGKKVQVIDQARRDILAGIEELVEKK